MTLPAPAPLLTPASAYRWLYLDVSSGDYSAVAIFMLGAPFSPRYSVESRRGGRPTAYSAVNFALYHRGSRLAWVLTEYPAAELQEPRAVRIGASSLEYTAQGLEVSIRDRTMPQGVPTDAFITLTAECPVGPHLTLKAGEPHFWQPIMARATARVRVPSLGLEFTGAAYHDTNHGEKMLGDGVEAWRWTRSHSQEATRIVYETRGASPIEVHATSDAVTVDAQPKPRSVEERRSGWGLKIPQSLEPFCDGALDAPRVLESSPFYARLEAVGPTHHAMGEIADFARFHRPWIRWMASYRTRVAEAA